MLYTDAGIKSFKLQIDGYKLHFVKQRDKGIKKEATDTNISCLFNIEILLSGLESIQAAEMEAGFVSCVFIAIAAMYGVAFDTCCI